MLINIIKYFYVWHKTSNTLFYLFKKQRLSINHKNKFNLKDNYAKHMI
jgi:hypothetical protein